MEKSLPPIRPTQSNKPKSFKRRDKNLTDKVADICCSWKIQEHLAKQTCKSRDTIFTQQRSYSPTKHRDYAIRFLKKAPAMNTTMQRHFVSPLLFFDRQQRP